MKHNTLHTALYFILSDDDFEIKSKIYSLNCLSCFIHILNYKMTLFSEICFFLYFLKLSSGRGFRGQVGAFNKLSKMAYFNVKTACFIGGRLAIRISP